MLNSDCSLEHPPGFDTLAVVGLPLEKNRRSSDPVNAGR